MDKDKKIGYNDAVHEVEEILARLGGEELDVDRMGAEVKRAAELITLCKEKLRKAEEEVAKAVVND
jgi:exodeoxyribonuclease VII small subunit